jgi:hypothetical protein
MFFKKRKRRPLLKKRAWITAADALLFGWVHSARPKSHYASDSDGDYGLINKSAMRTLGIFGVEQDEVIEIEITVVGREKI